jgi:hypothetical protein
MSTVNASPPPGPPDYILDYFVHQGIDRKIA